MRASGRRFNCVLGESSQVKCWGDNSYGKLGLGHKVHMGDSPEEALNRIPFVDIGQGVEKLSLGHEHACALLLDGGVKCWGHNRYGQLGLGHTRDIGDDESPSSIVSLSLGQPAIDISAGRSHSCAVLADKNIRCWGRNASGELGLGHRNIIGDDELPSSEPSLDFSDDAKQVFAGGNTRTCALFENNNVRCWGATSYGLLGYPSPYHYLAHITYTSPIDFGAPVQHVALGLYHTCASLHTGDLRCFGHNSYGQLGLGHGRDIGDSEFISFGNSSIFSEFASTVVARFEYSASETDPQSLTFDGSLSFARSSIKSYQWNFGGGSTSTVSNPTHRFNSFGSFEVSLTITDNFDQRATLSRLVNVERNNVSPYFGDTQEWTLEKAKIHSIELDEALDLDSSSLTYTIVQSPSQGTLTNCLGGTTDLACSYQAPSDFTGEVVFSYKANDGSSDSSPTLVKFRIVEPPSPILQVESGGGHTCALYENKRLRCWGYNSSGQLGLGHRGRIGDDEDPISSALVDVGANVVQISLGDFHTCALLENGRAKCWGANSSGQLGLGHTKNIGDDERPSSISPLDLGEPLRQIVASYNFTCALTESGKIKCWGENIYGQLGLAHTNSIGNKASEISTIFSPIKLGSRALKISLGEYHGCALLKEGRLRCWGYNRYGQLGLGHTHNIGDNEHPLVASNVSLGQKALDVATGNFHTCALLARISHKHPSALQFPWKLG